MTCDEKVISGHVIPNEFWTPDSKIFDSNMYPELIFESQVLESNVQNWFRNHKSWNQMFGFGFGITSLGIKCSNLVLESQVLESNVWNCFWNHKSWN